MRYLTITSPDVNNGTGFRVTLWVAGCNHKCKGCHNPHSWDYKQGNHFWKIKNDLFNQLNHEYIEGLTLSGGDPLAQSKLDLCELYYTLKYIKSQFPQKTIWIYTGYTFEKCQQDKIKMKILSLCDVLVDGPYKCNLRDTSLAFRGSSNQKIIDLNQWRNQF